MSFMQGSAFMRGRRRGALRSQPRSSPRKVIERQNHGVTAQPSADDRLLPPYIDEDTFQAMTRHALPLFVRFSSPRCGHSKAMDPAWNQLRRDFPMVVASIDCTRSPNLCQECQVGAYPTMRLYNAGRPGYIEYTGGRSHNELRTWLGRALQHAG